MPVLCPKCRAEIDLGRPNCASCGADLMRAFEERAWASEPALAAAVEEPSVSGPRCPRCRAEIDLGRPDCASCGADLLQAFEERAWGAESAAAAATPGAGLSRPAVRLALAAVLAGTAALGWFAAIRNTPAGRIAFDPPPGWEVEEPRGAIGRWDEVLRLSRGSASLSVLVGGDPEPSLSGATAWAAERFEGTDLRVERTGAATVGGREGWSVRVSGVRTGRWKGLAFQGQAVVVPWGSRSYLVQMSCDSSQFELRHREFERFLNGIRFL